MLLFLIVCVILSSQWVPERWERGITTRHLDEALWPFLFSCRLAIHQGLILSVWCEVRGDTHVVPIWISSWLGPICLASLTSSLAYHLPSQDPFEPPLFFKAQLKSLLLHEVFPDQFHYSVIASWLTLFLLFFIFCVFYFILFSGIAQASGMLSTGERVHELGAIPALRTFTGSWGTQTLGRLWCMWRVQEGERLWESWSCVTRT